MSIFERLNNILSEEGSKFADPKQVGKKIGFGKGKMAEKSPHSVSKGSSKFSGRDAFKSKHSDPKQVGKKMGYGKGKMAEKSPHSVGRGDSRPFSSRDAFTSKFADPKQVGKKIGYGKGKMAEKDYRMVGNSSIKMMVKESRAIMGRMKALMNEGFEDGNAQELASAILQTIDWAAVQEAITVHRGVETPNTDELEELQQAITDHINMAVMEYYDEDI